MGREGRSGRGGGMGRGGRSGWEEGKRVSRGGSREMKRAIKEGRKVGEGRTDERGSK